MNTILHKFAFALCASLGLLLSSCLDVEQEFWIHADGTGRIKVTNRIPTEAIESIAELQKGLAEGLGEALGAEVEVGEDDDDPYGIEEQKRDLQANRYVKSVEVAHTVEGETTAFTYDIQVRDMTKAHEILGVLFEGMDPEEDEEQPVNLEALFTAVRITRDRGSIYKFTADLGSGNAAQPANPGDKLSAELLRGLLGDTGITIRVHGASVKSGEKAPRKSEEWSAKVADLASGKSTSVEALVAAFKHPPRHVSPADGFPSLDLTDAKGRTIEASILGVTSEKVRIKLLRNGREYDVRRSTLSDRTNRDIDELKRPSAASR